MCCSRRKDALSNVSLVQMPNHARIARVARTGIQEPVAIGQDDLVAASLAEQVPQGILKEGNVCAVRQDQQMLPASLQPLRNLHLHHARSPFVRSL